MIYKKELDVIDEYDVIVCGGGPAGLCAAIQAGRMGLKTALIEKNGMLGGAITSGGNTGIALFHRHTDGRQVISGIGWELVTRMAIDGWAVIPEYRPGLRHSQMTVRTNAPMAAYYMDLMCIEAGVKIYLHQEAADVSMTENNGDKNIEMLLVTSRSGLIAIKAKMYIDCTGDGQVCAMAGAGFELGDASTGELQPGTLRIYPSGYKMEALDRDQVMRAYNEAKISNELKPGDFWLENMRGVFGAFQSKFNNANHINNINGADSESKTSGEIEGRKWIARVTSWARKRIKGAEDFIPEACAGEVCIRESRRILCDKYITVEDYLSAKSYNDSISYSYYPIDLHTNGPHIKDGGLLYNIHLEDENIPSIPLGAMLPLNFGNLMVAGRCISGDRLANSAFRVKASCMAMGQAAGAAAALSVIEKTGMRSLDMLKLRHVLKQYGAIVPGI